MDLIHNQLIRIVDDNETGIYRVIVDDKRFGKTALVKLSPLPNDPARGGRPRSSNRKYIKKPPVPLVGNLIWWQRSDLERLHTNHLLHVVELEPEAIYLTPIKSERDQQLFLSRRKAMAPFLDFPHMSDSILAYGDTARLVSEALEISSMSRAWVYKLFSMLCRLGFSESSLRPRMDRCGAPGTRRPCENGRRKPGAKTTKQRISKHYGVELEPEQPGVSEAWRQKVLAADSKIASPKPCMRERITCIINSGFVKRYSYLDKKLVEIELPIGSYPNRSQIRRILTTSKSRLTRLLEATTQGHYDRNKRGLRARNWKDVGGPGHTWAIDSTIGDIYLRSSLQPDWIVGRPIVYILVDVWSTAVVGFYICLSGPSWVNAKLALFCSAVDPNLIAELWGYTAIPTLNPTPTLPYILLCDRGEYLSQAARETAFNLKLDLSYTPPYRPDLKGLVEVLHRIEKDKQFSFVPGAIDQRRKEMELRRFNPNDGVLTVRHYAAILNQFFAEYNLTANRLHRLDAHMRAAGVSPTPAGLWRWGHETGIGYQRATPFSELATTLLPSADARITRNGIMHAGRHYQCQEIDDRQWTALARNFGSWEIGAHYFPGSVGRIWIPNTGGHGLLNLSICDQSTASAELTTDEVADAFMSERQNRHAWEHEKMKIALASKKTAEDIIERAQLWASGATPDTKYFRPSVREARHLESVQPTKPIKPLVIAPPSTILDEAALAHQSMMKALLEAQNYLEE